MHNELGVISNKMVWDELALCVPNKCTWHFVVITNTRVAAHHYVEESQRSWMVSKYLCRFGPVCLVECLKNNIIGAF
jgi:hypothetical protein